MKTQNIQLISVPIKLLHNTHSRDVDHVAIPRYELSQFFPGEKKLKNKKTKQNKMSMAT